MILNGFVRSYNAAAFTYDSPVYAPNSANVRTSLSTNSKLITTSDNAIYNSKLHKSLYSTLSNRLGSSEERYFSTNNNSDIKGCKHTAHNSSFHYRVFIYPHINKTAFSANRQFI